MVERFAPHTRGSTVQIKSVKVYAGVCPAHAGVYLIFLDGGDPSDSLPRTRGGLPCACPAPRGIAPFAPHTRGSTLTLQNSHQSADVCPAHAGVYPDLSASSGRYMRLPRTRGVYPCLGTCRPVQRRLPRTRGGLPDLADLAAKDDPFAPHTRGSTLRSHRRLCWGLVCPAHAGVYLGLLPWTWSLACLPRTRGGLPPAIPYDPFIGKFAPHTRGSTVPRAFQNRDRAVCPAHAGVYPNR